MDGLFLPQYSFLVAGGGDGGGGYQRRLRTFGRKLMRASIYLLKGLQLKYHWM